MKLGNEDTAPRHARTRREQYRSERVARKSSSFYGRFFGTRKRLITTCLVILLIPIVIVQLFWSTTSLLPNTYVGSVNLSSMDKSEAAQKLNAAYADTMVPVYFSDSDEVVVEPTLSDLGFTVKNEERVDTYSYPFVARLVPYSLFVYQYFMPKGEPQATQDTAAFSAYTLERFGPDCEFEPRNGTIAYIDEELQVVDASRGGSCDPAELTRALEGVSARLDPEKVTVNGTSTAPEISTATAKEEFSRLKKELSDGVSLTVQDKNEHIPTEAVSSWIEYTVTDGKLVLILASDEASAWLNERYGEKFTFDAGVTVVTLKDYKEASRESGKNGSALNTTATIDEVTKDLQGEKDTSTLMVDTIQPAIEYKRTFSPANPELSAVMKKYADSHAGTYGVKMVELSGSRRNASYDSTKVFTTASTYKLFVAYSVLLRIESGEWSWDMPSYGGLSVSTCFDRMIKLSNNECAVWFLLKISYAQVTAEAHALGATHTNFNRNTGISSTADDEAHFLSLLYTGQMLSQQASRDRLIAAMDGNVYVAGIPTGIPDVKVADKVGFLDGLLHDAAIVYSKKGDYVLIIMTDNASWANIAELAAEIEAAR